MTSGKQAKRARRVQAPAPVRSKAAPAPRKASPKVLIAAAVVLVVIGGVVAAVFAFTGGSSSSSASVPRRGSLVNALPGAADVNRLFKGIPQHGNVLGS